MDEIKSRLFESLPRGRVRLFNLCLAALCGFLVIGILQTPASRPQDFVLPSKSSDKHLTSASIADSKEKDSVNVPKSQSAAASSKPTWNGWAAVENIFVFGDSYTDNGFSPTGHQPDDTNPFGNWDRLPQGGIFTPRWPNLLALTYNQSYIRVWNYAWTGSTIDKKVVPAWALSLDFPTQVSMMMEAMTKPELEFHQWNAENSLVATFIGVNDVNLSADEGKEGPVVASMAAFKENMDKLYDAGARNFLILNTPPIDIVMQKHLELVPSGLATYNLAFKQLQQTYLRSKPDTTVFLFDTHRLMVEILENPKNFPETSEIDDVGMFLPTCMSCEFAAPNANLTEALCTPDSRKHFWCEWMHIGFPVQNAIAANIMKDCFSSSRRTGYCS